MGNPSIWYKAALENLALILHLGKQETLEAMSIEELRNLIDENKNSFSERTFYYNAGIATQMIVMEAWETGVDALNASCGGLADFCDFIGVEDQDEYS